MLSWFPIYFPIRVRLFYLISLSFNSRLAIGTSVPPRWIRITRFHVAPHGRQEDLVRMVWRILPGSQRDVDAYSKLLHSILSAHSYTTFHIFTTPVSSH